MKKLAPSNKKAVIPVGIQKKVENPQLEALRMKVATPRKLSKKYVDLFESLLQLTMSDTTVVVK